MHILKTIYSSLASKIAPSFNSSLSLDNPPNEESIILDLQRCKDIFTYSFNIRGNLYTAIAIINLINLIVIFLSSNSGTGVIVLALHAALSLSFALYSFANISSSFRLHISLEGIAVFIYGVLTLFSFIATAFFSSIVFTIVFLCLIVALLLSEFNNDNISDSLAGFEQAPKRDYVGLLTLREHDPISKYLTNVLETQKRPLRRYEISFLARSGRDLKNDKEADEAVAALNATEVLASK